MKETTWEVTKSSLGSGRDFPTVQSPRPIFQILICGSWGRAWELCVSKAYQVTLDHICSPVRHHLTLCVSELDLGSPLKTRGYNFGSAQKSFEIKIKAFSDLSKGVELLSATREEPHKRRKVSVKYAFE